ncbi:MAG TPA: hypothetical protein DD640_07255, partial [Clostridiales bacterium]|nr:hypothetical protein [Clostridiales bacterium]
MAAEQVKRRFWMFWRQIIQIDLLTEIIQVAMIASLLIIPVQYFFPEYAGWDIVGMTLAALVLWQVRLRSRQLWQFILACLALLAVPVMLPLPAWPKAILALSILVLAVRAFILRIRQQESQIQLNLGSTAVVIGYFLALSILTQKLLLTQLTQAYFYITAGYLVLSVWRWH